MTANGHFLSTAAVERAKPAAQTRGSSPARGSAGPGGFCCRRRRALLSGAGRSQARGGDRLGLWPLLVLGIWASDSHPVRVRNRKYSLSIGLSEIPVLVGVVFLRPGLALGAVACGYFAANVQQRRPLMKTLVHTVIYVAAVGAGIAVYYVWLGKASPVGEHGWLVSAATRDGHSRRGPCVRAGCHGRC